MLSRLRRALLGSPAEFDPRWDGLLSTEFQHWRTLTAGERDRMEWLLAEFVHGWRWEPAKDFDLTEEVKVLIAAQAAMLLLGLDIDEFPHLSSVIVHPSTVRLTGHHAVGGRLMSSAPRTLLGQAQYRGPVVLSWSAARSGARRPERGQNVVYHEFAHRLDMLDGVTDGTPPLDDPAARERWVEVCTTAYDTVRAEGSPVLRPYAGTNPAEFFAVATEVFFNRPHDLCEHEPDLYQELRGFYRQDPAARPAL
jgi:Mlc titration factor MtfA (ptsG expression regulator)